MRYSIEDTTLTALGDAIRDKTGKLTKTEYVSTILFEDEIIKPAGSWGGMGTYTCNLSNVYSAKLKLTKSEIISNYNMKITYNYYTDGWTKHAFTFDENGEATLNSLTGQLRIGIEFRNNSSRDSVDTLRFEIEATCYPGENLSGEVIKAPIEVPNTITPLQMVEEIESIKEYVEPAIEALKIIANGVYTAPKGIDGYNPITVNVPIDIPTDAPTDEELTISGDGSHRFRGSNWDWFINKYGDRMITKDLYNVENMFYGSKLSKLPFDLNFNNTSFNSHNLKGIFTLCYDLIEIPKFNNCIPQDASGMFSYCQRLKELDYESVKDLDWSYMDTQTSQYGCSRANTFQNCYSLRSFPMEFLNHGNPVGNYSYSIFSGLFSSCYVLDEVIDLPNPHSQASWTSNAFNCSFDDCYRLKNIIFALQDDGTPYVCSKWKKQTIDLSKFVGYTQAMYKVRITDFNSGITADKEVKDDATYQALKNDPDWYTADINYSRYNHDSAVATINTLPDCSALGGNTIKFKGASGALTDGGAINTLTEEEIAVATAKGWTVSFV